MTPHFSQVEDLDADRVHQGERAHRGNGKVCKVTTIRHNNEHTSHERWLQISVNSQREHNQMPVEAGSHQPLMILLWLFRGENITSNQEGANRQGNQNMLGQIKMIWSKLKKIITELGKIN